jgi:hypothetical protein
MKKSIHIDELKYVVRQEDKLREEATKAGAVQ